MKTLIIRKYIGAEHTNRLNDEHDEMGYVT